MRSTVPAKVRSGNDFLDVLSEAEGKCTEHLLGLLLHTQPATPALDPCSDTLPLGQRERERTAAVFSCRVLKDGHHPPQNGV